MCLPSDAVSTGRLPYLPSINVAPGDQNSGPPPSIASASAAGALPQPSAVLFHPAENLHM